MTDAKSPSYVKKETVRRMCDTCGEHEAIKRHCYVLEPTYRDKPAAAWSSDYSLFQCAECDELDIEDDVPALHKWNCSFERGVRFDHMFWETRETPVDGLIDTLSAYPALREEIERLRGALAFYADKKNHKVRKKSGFARNKASGHYTKTISPKVMLDKGRLARRTLKGDEDNGS